MVIKTYNNIDFKEVNVLSERSLPTIGGLLNKTLKIADSVL
jgi:hypothetical protein